MKRWWILSVLALIALFSLTLACGDDDDDDDDNNNNNPSDDDDETDDDAAGGACDDELLNKYAAFCPDYADPCKSSSGEVLMHDNEQNYGNSYLLTGELEGTQFKLTEPFHIKKMKLYFEGEGQAKIHIYADLLGSVPHVIPWEEDTEAVEYMEPMTVDVDGEGWVELDVSDRDLMFLPGTKFWVVYEHLNDDGYPRLLMSKKANTNYGSRIWDKSWADDPNSGGFKWDIADYHYMITLEGSSFCVYEGSPWFTDTTENAGLSGVIGQHRTGWADLDGDGDQDMIVTNLATTDPNTSIIYRNNGDGTFTNITIGSGLDGGYLANMTVFADYDNDGDEDAFLIKAQLWPTGDDDDTTDDDTSDDDTADDDTTDDDTVDSEKADESFSVVLDNDGSGNFTLNEDAGIGVYGNLSSVGLGDFDRDGYLDLYIGAWLKEYPYSPSDPDYLFHNNGDNSFSDVSADSGILDVIESPCYGVTWVDFNDDGWYDVFVSNYGRTRNFLFENKKNGTFTNVANDKNLDSPLERKAGNTFGADFGDLNNDGYFDAMLTDIAHPRYQPDSGPSSVNINQGPPNYDYAWANDTTNYNPDEGDVDPSFIDFNNDGRLDLYVSSLYDDHFSRIYEQQEDGTLLDVTYWAGTEMIDCTGNAWADFDGDGDVDLLAGFRSPGGGVKLFRNEIGTLNNWLAIKLIGTESNRDAIGAKITVTAGDLVQVRYVQGARGHYGAQPSLVMHFGLAQEGAVDKIEVRWPNGDTEEWTGATVNGYITLTEGNPSVGE